MFLVSLPMNGRGGRAGADWPRQAQSGVRELAVAHLLGQRWSTVERFTATRPSPLPWIGWRPDDRGALRWISTQVSKAEVGRGGDMSAKRYKPSGPVQKRQRPGRAAILIQEGRSAAILSCCRLLIGCGKHEEGCMLRAW